MLKNELKSSDMRSQNETTYTQYLPLKLHQKFQSCGDENKIKKNLVCLAKLKIIKSHDYKIFQAINFDSKFYNIIYIYIFFYLTCNSTSES